MNFEIRDNCRVSAMGTDSVKVGSGLGEIDISRATSAKTGHKQLPDSHPKPLNRDISGANDT